MIGRSFRLAVSGLCVISLLACLAAGWLWWRSYRAPGALVRRGQTNADRYTVHSGRGRLELRRAPPEAASLDAAVRNALRVIANDQVRWAEHVQAGRGHAYMPYFDGVEGLRLGVAEFGELRRPLLDALDDPARFAAAHVLLATRTEAAAAPVAWAAAPPPMPEDRDIDRAFVIEYVGLRAQVRPPATDFIDPAQLPSLRQYWHDRLDVTVSSVAYRWLALATALPPFAWGGAAAAVCAAGKRRGRAKRQRRDIASRLAGRAMHLATAYAAVGSVLLTLGIGWLWRRSHRHAPLGEDRFSWVTARARRYTLRSDAGRITLFAPPPWDPAVRPSCGLRTDSDINGVGSYPQAYANFDKIWSQTLPLPRPAPQDPSLGDLIPQLRNDQLKWTAVYDRWRRVLVICQPEMREATPAWRFTQRHYEVEIGSGQQFGFDPPMFTPAAAAPALLPALEDPDRFIIAHVLLAELLGLNDPKERLSGSYRGEAPYERASFTPFPDGSAETRLAGLRIQLARLSTDRLPNDPSIRLRDGVYDWPYFDRRPPVWVDPAQIPAVRDGWHRRLDVVDWSVPHWQFMIAAALPLGWIGGIRLRRTVVRRLRAHDGRCVACGYDLRSSPERCPECGAVPAESHR